MAWRADGPIFAGCLNDAEAVERVRREIVNRSHAELLAPPGRAALESLCEMGPDLNILTYAFNLRIDGRMNQDLALANELNRRIHEQASVQADGREIYGYRLLVSTTDLRPEEHGAAFIDSYRDRLLGPAVVGHGRP